MPQPMSITSLTNPRVKALVRLRQQADERRATGRFAVESLRELQRAAAAGFAVRELYACEELPGGNSPALLQLAAEQHVEPVSISRPVLEKIAYRENPQGFLAVLETRTAKLAELRLDKPELIVVLSGLEKPGNVGAIARTAEAAGVSAMFIDSPDFDLFNPNCIRASTGAVFALPIVCDSAERLGDWLKQQRIVTIALTPEAALTTLALNLREPAALVVGAEAEGLGAYWKSAADLCASIPMRSGIVDSLNVSVSAAVMLFEAMRQRVG